MKSFQKLVLLVLCVFSNVSLAMTFEEAAALAEKQFSKGNSALTNYLNRRMEYENEISLD